MDTVHVFLPNGDFVGWRSLYDSVHPTYTPDGESIPSVFMREAGFASYEPACIECIHSESPKPLAELLSGASYLSQWVAQLPVAQPAAACAVCVFSPNLLLHPDQSQWQYVGAFTYDPEMEP